MAQETADKEGVYRDQIAAHIERYIGPIEGTFEEIEPDAVRINIHVISPAEGRPYTTLVTTGVSDLAMNVPSGAERFERAELLIALPPDWPLEREQLENEQFYWPIGWLKTVGRMPHSRQTWIGVGHTMRAANYPNPIANTGFAGFLLMPPFWLDPEFFQLETSNGDIVTFVLLVPIYPGELELKVEEGTDALIDLFDAKGFDFILDIRRQDVSK